METQPRSKKKYEKPAVRSSALYERESLACQKTTNSTNPDICSVWQPTFS